MAKTKKLEHKPMCCPLCGERFLNLMGQPLPNHAQIRCHTEAGDEMDIGVCDNCIEKGVSQATLNGILEGIKDFWVFEIDADDNLVKAEKDKRKAVHKAHKIDGFTAIQHTGKEAERDAREKGKLR